MAETAKIHWKMQGKYLLLHALIMLVAFLLPFQKGESMFGMWGIPSLWRLFVVLVLPILSPIALACVFWRKLFSQKALNIALFLVSAILLSAFFVLWFT